MKQSFRKLTSWLVVATMFFGLSLSASPALAEQEGPPPGWDEIEGRVGGTEKPVPETGGFQLMAAPGLRIEGKGNTLDFARRIAGDGITITSATTRGEANAFGRFFGGSGIIGLNEGIVLSTGKAHDVRGPNEYTDTTTRHNCTFKLSSGWSCDPSSGDSDLNSLVPGLKSYDAAELTIKFIPDGDVFSFEYVFASEEYPEWVDDVYKDAFGAFLTNPVVTKYNAATVPGTSEHISIHSINGNRNSTYYINNNFQKKGKRKYDTEMDGFTTVLKAEVPVVPGVENTLKLVIADVGDGAWDSAVFIKAGSMTSWSSDSEGPQWPEGAQIAVAQQCGIVTIEWPEASDPSVPIDYFVTLDGEELDPTQDTSLVSSSLSPGLHSVSVVPQDAKGNHGPALSTSFEVDPESTGAIYWLGDGRVENGGTYNIQFKSGSCHGAEFDKTVAVKLRNQADNKLIAGFVYGHSIQFDEETRTYSQLFDTNRFNIRNAVINIYVYFGNKLQEIGSFIVGD